MKKFIILIPVYLLFSVILIEYGLMLKFPNKIITETRNHIDEFIPKVRELKKNEDDLSFDENGFRVGTSNCKTTKINTKKILIVGDSNIEARFLKDKFSISSQLSKSINSFDNNCFIVNSFGVSGYGPDQSLFAIKSIFEKEYYDFVILHFFADNDFGDIVRNNFPVNKMIIDNNGYCYIAFNFIEKTLLYRATLSIIDQLFGIKIKNTLKHSMNQRNLCTDSIPVKYENNFDYINKAVKIDFKNFLDNKKQVYTNDRYDLEFACKTNVLMTDFVTKRLDVILNNAREFIENNNSELIFLIQPSEFDVTINHLDVTKKIEESCENYSNDNLSDLAETIALKNNIKSINLFSDLDGCNECFFSKSEAGSDNHWNKKGIQVATLRLSDYILSYMNK